LVRAAVPGAEDAVCAACHRATGGNAFYIRALAEAIAEAGPAGPEETAARIGRWSPERVTRSVTARLSALGGECRELACARRHPRGRTPLRQAGLMAGVAPDRWGASADALRAAGILDPGEALAFVHPIVGVAVRSEIPPGARSDAHRRAARLLAEVRAPAGRVAAQLAATEPSGDTWVAEELERAAGEALGGVRPRRPSRS
jgi:hypothetical protein